MHKLAAIIHETAPHSESAMYVLSVICVICAIMFVYVRCAYLGTRHHLPDGWCVNTISQAAPFPVYVLLLFAPLDQDLMEVIKQDAAIIAMAGVYGMGEVLKGIKATASVNGHSRRYSS